MFIETYYDERVPVPATPREPMMPYPQLSGEELTVWRKYLPVGRRLGNLYSLFIETIPGPMITEIEKANKPTRLFDRIEFWSSAADPMAVGEIEGAIRRDYSIARWG